MCSYYSVAHSVLIIPNHAAFKTNILALEFNNSLYDSYPQIRKQVRSLKYKKMDTLIQIVMPLSIFSPICLSGALQRAGPHEPRQEIRRDTAWILLRKCSKGQGWMCRGME